MDFADSWNAAERVVFNSLIKATGGEEGKNAFLGLMPTGMVNIWAMNSGGPGGEEQTLWTPSIVTVHIFASLVGLFAQRADAQRWAMRCIGAMPAITTGNVAAFRVRQGGFPEPKPEEVTLANQPDRKYLAFSMVIGCELVFDTGTAG